MTHYIDGKRVGQSKITTVGFPLTFGDTEIGNWPAPRDVQPTKIRTLNGRIDELTLFKAALSAKEVQALYRGGVR